MTYFISVITELLTCLINSTHNKFEEKLKKKSYKTMDDKGMSNLKIFLEAAQDLELSRYFETCIENEEMNSLINLVSMTEFYHKKILNSIKQPEIDLDSIKDDKAEKYETIYTHLISILKERLKSNEISNILL